MMRSGRSVPPAQRQGPVHGAGGIGYYLAGRRTDDELLAEVEAAWVEYEELTDQERERAIGRGLAGRRADPTVEERARAAGDRYRAAWRRWFDGRARQGASARSGEG